jgi:quercetin dioxygenase-like cupin family protein
MASSHRDTLDNKLPAIARFITRHNDEGKAVFSNRINESLQWQDLPDGARFCLGFTTQKTPVEMNNDKDLSDYEKHLENKPGIMIPGGTVLRLVDMRPGALSPMHRTVSLDYGVVLEGEVELVLDSGEVRLMKQGDVAVQRGTNHAWRNASATNWARMLYVLLESEPVKVGSQLLDEDYGGIPGVKPSRH